MAVYISPGEKARAGVLLVDRFYVSSLGSCVAEDEVGGHWGSSHACRWPEKNFCSNTCRSYLDLLNHVCV